MLLTLRTSELLHNMEDAFETHGSYKSGALVCSLADMVVYLGMFLG